LQSRYTEKKPLDGLRVLRTRSPTSTDCRPDHHRNNALAIVHVVVLRGVVHQLIERKKDEIGTVMHENRTHTVHGRTSTNTHHAFFRHGRVEDSVAAVFLFEPTACAE